jgi:hypothetical protein
LLKPGDSVAWIGLGGDGADGGGPLAQTGTGQDEVKTWYGQWVGSYYAWYEDVPGQPIQKAFGVNCGDTISAEVWQSGSPVHMWLEDFATGNYLSQTNNQISNGSTAEWIVERPTVNNSLPPLCDFRGVNFYSDEAWQNGTNYPLNNLPYNVITPMWSNNWSQVLATTGGLGSDGSFTVNWQAYGP